VEKPQAALNPKIDRFYVFKPDLRLQYHPNLRHRERSITLKKKFAEVDDTFERAKLKIFWTEFEEYYILESREFRKGEGYGEHRRGMISVLLKKSVKNCLQRFHPSA